MNQKDLFKISPTIDLVNNKTITVRPSEDQNITQQKFNIMVFNHYLYLKDFQSYIKDNETEETYGRGYVLQTDHLQITPRFPDGNDYPYFELFKDSTDNTKYFHIYQNIYNQGSFNTSGNIVSSNDVILIDTDNNNEGQQFNVSFDTINNEEVLSLKKYPYVLNPTDPQDEYISLRVKNLYVEGDSTVINTQTMVVEDPIIELNITDGQTLGVQNGGVRVNEPDGKYGIVRFDVQTDNSSQEWKFIEKGYTTTVEELQDLRVKNLNQEQQLNTPQINTQTIQSNNDLNINFQNKLLINTDGLIIDEMNDRMDIRYDTYHTGMLYQDGIEQDNDQFFLGNINYDTNIYGNQINLISNQETIVLDNITIENDSLIKSGTSSLAIKHQDDPTTKLQLTIEQNTTHNGDFNVFGSFRVGNGTETVNIWGQENNIGQQSSTNNIRGFTHLYNDTEMDGNLTVDGTVNFTNTTTTHTLHGNYEISDSGNTTTIKGDLIVNGTTSLGNSLTVSGDSTLNGNNNIIGNDTSSTTIKGNVTIQENGSTTQIMSPTLIHSTLNVQNNTTIDGDLTVFGSITQDSISASHTHDQGDITSGILQIERGGTNNDTYTNDKFLTFDGTKIISSNYDQTSFSPTNHNHDSVYVKLIDFTGTNILNKLLSVDGSGSGLDQDTLDGMDSTQFQLQGHNHNDLYYTKTQLQTQGQQSVDWDNLINVPPDIQGQSSTLKIGDGTTQQLIVNLSNVFHIQQGNDIDITYDDTNDKITISVQNQTSLNTNNSIVKRDSQGSFEQTDISLTGTLSQNTINQNIVNQDLNGNQTTQSQLQTQRTISLSGDISGSQSFDGSQDITITQTVQDNSHSHDDSTITNVDWSKILNIPTTLDGYGIIDQIKNGGNTPKIIQDVDQNKPDPQSEGLGTIYITTDTNTIYRNDGTQWVSIGGGNGDQDTLDGLDSSQFLRSDTDDTLNGNLTVNGNISQTTFIGNLQGNQSSQTNQDTVDGKHASQFQDQNHTHTKSEITDFSHTHNGIEITSPTSPSSQGQRRIIASTTAPTSSDGNNGDIWIVYSQ